MPKLTKRVIDDSPFPREGLMAINNARQQTAKNPANNEYQVLLITQAWRRRRSTRSISRLFDSARKNLTGAADALERDLSASLEGKAMGVLAQEVRQHIKAIDKHEDRHSFVLQALKEGGMNVLTSVLGAPAFLSGFSKEEQGLFTRTYREAAAPEAVRRLTATRKAIDLLERRTGIVHLQFEQALGGKWSTVLKLRKAQSEQEKALLMEKEKADPQRVNRTSYRRAYFVCRCEVLSAIQQSGTRSLHHAGRSSPVCRCRTGQLPAPRCDPRRQGC